MKKYLLVTLAIVSAIVMSAFTTPKTPPPPTLYSFVFTGLVTEGGDVSKTDVGHTTYTKWMYISSSALYCDLPGNEIACTITVSSIFTHTDGQGRILLNASDPDGLLGVKLAFPLFVEIGCINFGTTFYKVNELVQIPGVLLIDNTVMDW